MKDKTDFYQLIQKRLQGVLSDEEKAQLLEALNDVDNIHILSGLVEEFYNKEAAEHAEYDEAKLREMIRVILSGETKPLMQLSQKASEIELGRDAFTQTGDNVFAEQRKAKLRILGNRWVRYAAAAVLLMGAGLYYYNLKNNTPNPPTAVTLPLPQTDHNDVLPGSSKAILTLSNGKKVELDDKGQQVISDAGLAIRVSDGALAYTQTDLVVYNTMSTPRGGQYKLNLPDGTTVWLNASSSITYPTAFPGNTREVTITGEAYFEVAKNAAKPFIVKTYKDEITVKGTSFNVNSYDDEDGIRTSLLEGLVQISGMMLTPGNAYQSGKIVTTDLNRDLAWKNGVFNFHEVKLKQAMRQIARWYDVEVKYEGNVDHIELGGEIGRNLSLQQVLNGLQDKDLHFRLEGRILTVY